MPGRAIGRTSKCFAYAVTDKSGETITFYEYGGISSTDKSNIETWGEWPPGYFFGIGGGV